VNGANLVKPARHSARKNSAAGNMHATEPEQQIASVDTAGDRVNPGPEQQWVVLAAWEEVRTVSHTSSDTTSDYEPNAVAEDGAAQTSPDNTTTGTTAGQAASKTPHPNQTSSQYTVTRLILRVVPANSNSTQPATAVARGGWFVIQL